MRTRLLPLVCTMVIMAVIAGCSSVEVTNSSVPDNSTPVGDMSLDVNVYFAPESQESALDIAFAVPGPGWVKLEVLNATGYRVRLLLDQYLNAYEGQVSWNGRNSDGDRIESGIYIYRLQWNDRIWTKLVPVCRTIKECEELYGND